MRFQISILTVICLVCATHKVFSQAADSIRDEAELHVNSEEVEFVKGADVSRLDKAEDYGALYKVNGVPKDALHIFKDHWLNYIRLMLWHTPAENYHNLEKVLYMAQRVKAMDLKLLLDIFYSDSWANPGVQTKPAAWSDLAFETLKDSVFQYALNVITALRDQNTLPDMVQLGNEIAGGFLWDDGRVGGEFDTPEQWQKFGELLSEAIRGIHEGLEPGESVKIMIHIHAGSDNAGCRWFFDNVIAQNVDFDVIGLSYYSWWHGTLNEVEANLNDLAQRYDKDIIIVETAYPWTLQWSDDYPNQVWQLSQLHAGYDASVDGQRAFLGDLMAIVRNVPSGRGKGIFYFSPEWISVPGLGCDWENVALFDFNGVLLPSVDAFSPPSLARVTLHLNAASIPDTVRTDAFFEVRGEVNGTAPDTLPDGNIIDWTNSSNIVLTHTGGDYFKASFVVPAVSELKFKFWSEDAEQLGLNGGWDIGDSNGDGFGNTVLIAARDTTLPLHFFNGIGDRKPYDWRLWEPKEDSIAVWFRVYMNTLEGVNDGYDPSASNQVIGLRGDNLDSAGPLDWGTTKVLLQSELEDENLASFHLFSGVAYYPMSLVSQWQAYKFFIEPNGWEEGNLEGNRIFAIPSQDTTLHWVYYGDTLPIQEDTICVRFDVSCDGAINVLDVLAVINHILGTVPITDPDALVRADCNDDGVVNILDALSIVNVILGIGECAPGACKTKLTAGALEFLKALELHLRPSQ